MIKHLSTGLAAAAALATFPLGEASAQGNSHRNGAVQAASFFSTTQATSTRSTGSCFVIVQSMVAQSLAMEVTFRDPRNIVIPGGLNVPADLVAGTTTTCRVLVRPGA